LSSGQYLASPPYVVMYAIMGNIAFDWEHDPIGKNEKDEDIMLKDIWFDNEELQ